MILVGHSLGLGISVIEAATYNDVNAVILSGFASAINQTSFQTMSAAVEEAERRPPNFVNLPSGYETTEPGTRRELFYNAPDADPNVIALDELLKQTMTDELGQ